MSRRYTHPLRPVYTRFASALCRFTLACSAGSLYIVVLNLPAILNLIWPNFIKYNYTCIIILLNLFNFRLTFVNARVNASHDLRSSCSVFELGRGVPRDCVPHQASDGAQRRISGPCSVVVDTSISGQQVRYSTS